MLVVFEFLVQQTHQITPFQVLGGTDGKVLMCLSNKLVLGKVGVTSTGYSRVLVIFFTLKLFVLLPMIW